MPRTARVLLDGGYYHILTRGIDKRILFYCAQDYSYFLEVMKEYLAKFKVFVMNYCLMPNHLHLLIYAEEARDLPRFMQLVLQVYASYFRKKYKSTGFIFQNRYKSRLINNDAYLLECARYIERNPLRAKIVKDLADYLWSSFSFYAREKEDAIITIANPGYLNLGDTKERRQQQYVGYASIDRLYEYIIDKEFKIR